jgi:hypothetical protein
MRFMSCLIVAWHGFCSFRSNGGGQEGLHDEGLDLRRVGAVVTRRRQLSIPPAPPRSSKHFGPSCLTSSLSL